MRKSTKMDVNKELLRKYAFNECTPIERLEVEFWLAHHDESQDNPLTVTEEQSLKEEIWSAISTKTLKKQNRFTLTKIAVAVAASIAGILLYAGLNPQNFSRTITINNPSSELTKQLIIGDLKLFIEPGSSVSVRVPLLRQSARTVSFCGAISVENNSQKDENFAIQTGSFECSGMKAKDLVKLHKGQTFLAMTDKDYHLISATKKELKDGLPRPFSLRLTEKFKL